VTQRLARELDDSERDDFFAGLSDALRRERGSPLTSCSEDGIGGRRRVPRVALRHALDLRQPDFWRKIQNHVRTQPLRAEVARVKSAVHPLPRFLVISLFVFVPFRRTPGA
jgi:hypothetical protein